MKIIVWGVNPEYTNQLAEVMNNFEIVCFMDNDTSKWDTLWNGVNILPPPMVRLVEYDRIYILDDNIFPQIEKQLEVFGVPKEKIWNSARLQSYIHCDTARIYSVQNHNYEVINIIPTILEDFHCYKICDFGMGLSLAGIKSQGYFEVYSSNGTLIDDDKYEYTGVVPGGSPYPYNYNNLYDLVLNENDVYMQKYDMVLIVDLYVKHTLQEVTRMIGKVAGCTRYILITLPSRADMPKWENDDFSGFGKLNVYSSNGGEHFVIIDTGENSMASNMRIYVPGPKKFTKLYNPDTDRIRIPVVEETLVHTTPLSCPDNLRALYWVWKNTKNAYVGFEKYNRVFLANPNRRDSGILDENEVVKYLEHDKYDILVARCVYISGQSVEAELKIALGVEAYGNFDRVIRESIGSICPEYLDAYDECLHGVSYYPGNMFITRWKWFEEYCNWLFGIVGDVADMENRHVMEMFTQILFTVWLMGRGLRIREMYFKGDVPEVIRKQEDFGYIYVHLYDILFRYHCYTIADYGMGLAKAGIKGREFFFDYGANCQVDISGCFKMHGIQTGDSRDLAGYCNIYSDIHEDSEMHDTKYDMVLVIGGAFSGYDDERISGIVEEISKCTRYILVTAPLDDRFLEKFKNIDKYSTPNGECFCVIETGVEEPTKDINIYVVTHKEFEPLYDAKTNRIRKPILGGSALRSPIDGYGRDDTGDNISHLNPYLNEFGVMYWVWKNCGGKYIGFEHYRRALIAHPKPFGVDCYGMAVDSKVGKYLVSMWPRNEDAKLFLTEREVVKYLEEDGYDYIINRCFYTPPISVNGFFNSCVDGELYKSYYTKVRGRIEKISPEYLDAFDACFLSCSFYNCTLFITKKENFDECCKWLFSIILDVIEIPQLSAYDTYNQRIVGMFAERLLTVWYLRHDFRFKELSYLFAE